MRLKIALSITALFPAVSLAQTPTANGSITHLGDPYCAPLIRNTALAISGTSTCGYGGSFGTGTGTISATGGDILVSASSFGTIQRQTQATVQTVSYVTVSDPGSIFRVDLRSRNLVMTTTIGGPAGKGSAFVEVGVKGFSMFTNPYTGTNQFAYSDRQKFMGVFGEQTQAVDACQFCPYGAPTSTDLFMSFLGYELGTSGVFALALYAYTDATAYGGGPLPGSGEGYASMDGYDVRLYSRDAQGLEHDVTAQHTISFNPADPVTLPPVTVTPEPATLGLMATGLLALVAMRRRKSGLATPRQEQGAAPQA